MDGWIDDDHCTPRRYDPIKGVLASVFPTFEYVKNHYLGAKILKNIVILFYNDQRPGVVLRSYPTFPNIGVEIRDQTLATQISGE